jgi:hypothetical protein
MKGKRRKRQRGESFKETVITKLARSLNVKLRNGR